MEEYECVVFSSDLCIKVSSDDKAVIDHLLNGNINKEFIPSFKVASSAERWEYSIAVKTHADRNDLIIAPRQIILLMHSRSIYLPDVTFLLLTSFSRLYLERGEVVIHSTAINCNGKGFLLIGDQGDGKKELALEAGLEGCELVSTENTVLKIENGVPIVTAATDLLHVCIDKSAFTKTKTIKISKKSTPKTHISKRELHDLGIRSADACKIAAILYPKITPDDKTFDYGKLDYPADLLRFYKYTGAYVSGGANLFVSSLSPFPNLESGAMRIKRIELSKKVSEATEAFEVFGAPERVVEFIRNL